MDVVNRSLQRLDDRRPFVVVVFHDRDIYWIIVQYERVSISPRAVFAISLSVSTDKEYLSKMKFWQTYGEVFGNHIWRGPDSNRRPLFRPLRR